LLEALALCVAKISDGDTFWTFDRVKVRLVAASGSVDAPDKKESPRCKPGAKGWCNQALAIRASQRLGQLIRGRGAVMQCNGHDKYRRVLCRVTVNCRDVGDTMVAEGLAVIRNDW
jgi:endonuclease YncB( thermonuclease family)